MYKLKLFGLFSVILILLAFNFVNGQKPAQNNKLEKLLISFGYKITSKSVAPSAGWEKSDFKMQGKQIFSIKSKNKVAGEKNLYYRFTVTIEKYESEADAQKRLELIQSTPPG